MMKQTNKKATTTKSTLEFLAKVWEMVSENDENEDNIIDKNSLKLIVHTLYIGYWE